MNKWRCWSLTALDISDCNNWSNCNDFHVLQASRNGCSSSRESCAVNGRAEPQRDPCGHGGETLCPHSAGCGAGYAWRYNTLRWLLTCCCPEWVMGFILTPRASPENTDDQNRFCQILPMLLLKNFTMLQLFYWIFFASLASVVIYLLMLMYLSISSDFRIEEYVFLLQTPAEITMYLCKIIVI